MSRHTSAALSMAAASASAQALGICGGFRLYTLRRAQPLSMCRHTGAGHSCHRFRLHDRRLASYSSQRLDAPAVWCSVFPPSFAARRVRPLMPRIVGWCSTGGILHTEGVAADAPTPPHPCEGGRGMGAQGHTLPHSHFKSIFWFSCPLKVNLQILSVFYSTC